MARKLLQIVRKGRGNLHLKPIYIGTVFLILKGSDSLCEILPICETVSVLAKMECIAEAGRGGVS